MFITIYFLNLIKFSLTILQKDNKKLRWFWKKKCLKNNYYFFWKIMVTKKENLFVRKLSKEYILFIFKNDNDLWFWLLWKKKKINFCLLNWLKIIRKFKKKRLEKRTRNFSSGGCSRTISSVTARQLSVPFFLLYWSVQKLF